MYRIRENTPIRSTHQSIYAYIELRTPYHSRPGPTKGKAASLNGTSELGRSVLLCPSFQLFSPRPSALNSDLMFLINTTFPGTARVLASPPYRGKDVQTDCLDPEAGLAGTMPLSMQWQANTANRPGLALPSGRTMNH